MSIGKAKVIEKEIERARLTGNWEALPELARRYRKHETNGSGLQHIVLAEHALAQIISEIDSTLYEYDHPTSLPLHFRFVTPIEISPGLELVEVGRQNSSSNLVLAQQASIIKAKLLFAAGNYEEMATVLKPLDLLNTASTTSAVGYARVLHIRGLLLEGLYYEYSKEDTPEAIKHYEAASFLVGQSTYPGAKEDKLQLEFQCVIEDVLYRLVLLQLRVEQNQKAVGTFRQYFTESSIWPKKFRPQKQLVILRYFLVLLAQLYQRGEHVPCPANLASNLPKLDSQSTMSIYSPAAFRDELSNLQTRYETLTYSMIQFPTANTINFKVLDMADQFVNNWGLLKNSRAIDTRNLVDSLYRATKHTYQSPRLLRHLTTALIALGEYEEAQLAVEAYVQLIEKSSEVGNPCILDITQERESFSMFTLDGSELEFRRSIAQDDKEPLSSIIETYLVGARLNIQEFGSYLYAVKLSELAVKHCQSRPNHHLHLISRAYQYLGVAKGYLSMQADQPATRTKFHDQSLDALLQAVRLDADNWEGHFFLGLQQAEGRDIKEAIQSVKRSLELQSLYAPAWHLLVLLLSCQKQYTQAISVCELAIREAEHSAEIDSEANNNSNAPNDGVGGSGDDGTIEGETTLGLLTTHLDGEDLLSLKTTHNLLQDAILGTKVALNHHGSLFALYARVYGNAQDDSTLVSISPTTKGGATNAATFPRTRGNASNLNDSNANPNNNSTLARPISVANTVSGNINSNNSSGLPGGNGTFPRNPRSLMPAASVYGLHISTRSLPRLLSRRKQGVQVLVGLWLQSAEAYRRLSKYDDARLAAEEAEQVDSSSPEVWCQYGKIYLSQKHYPAAYTSLQRAILLDPEHVEGLTTLGQYYIDTMALDQAEACLRTVTAGPGWSSALGWYLLGKVYRLTNRPKQAQSCMMYALDLNLTAPVRPFRALWSLRNLS